jgi:hypothetical protein
MCPPISARPVRRVARRQGEGAGDRLAVAPEGEGQEYPAGNEHRGEGEEDHVKGNHPQDALALAERGPNHDARILGAGSTGDSCRRASRGPSGISEAAFAPPPRLFPADTRPRPRECRRAGVPSKYLARQIGRLPPDRNAVGRDAEQGRVAPGFIMAPPIGMRRAAA